jgi:hypothetical protein
MARLASSPRLWDATSVASFRYMRTQLFRETAMSHIHAIRSTSDGAFGVSVGDSPLMRSAPEPRNSLGSWVTTAGNAVASTTSALTGIGASMMDGASITNLLNQQIQIQQIMQTTSMLSNVYRSQHETEMAPIRNMRVG